jgi:hypothetical protein
MNFSGAISVLTSTNFGSGPVITAFSFSMKLSGTVALAGWVSGSLEDAAFCEPLPATADLFTGRGLDGRFILVTVHEEVRRPASCSPRGELDRRIIA